MLIGVKRLNPKEPRLGRGAFWASAQRIGGRRAAARWQRLRIPHIVPYPDEGIRHCFDANSPPAASANTGFGGRFRILSKGSFRRPYESVCGLAGAG